MQSGFYRLYTPDPATHFEEDMVQIEKFNPKKPITAIYYDADTKEYMVKRFLVEMSDKKTLFISESPESTLEYFSTDTFPRVMLEFGKMGKLERKGQDIKLDEFIGIKGLKAKGKRLASQNPKKIIELESDPEPVEEEPEEPVATTIENSIPPTIIDLEGDEPQMSLFEG